MTVGPDLSRPFPLLGAVVTRLTDETYAYCAIPWASISNVAPG